MVLSQPTSTDRRSDAVSETHLFVKSSRAQSGAALSVIPPHTNTACRSHDVASS